MYKKFPLSLRLDGSFFITSPQPLSKGRKLELGYLQFYFSIIYFTIIYLDNCLQKDCPLYKNDKAIMRLRPNFLHQFFGWFRLISFQ